MYSICRTVFDSGHQSLAEVLLRNGANINAENSDKRTPLHLAVSQGKRYFKVKIVLESKRIGF